MDEEALKTSMRKFLKRVGVTSQQEIEKALRAAQAAGQISTSTVAANVTLTIPEIGLHHEINGDLQLEKDSQDS